MEFFLLWILHRILYTSKCNNTWEFRSKKPTGFIAANKIDMEDSSPATLKSAFPQHPVIPISA